MIAKHYSMLIMLALLLSASIHSGCSALGYVVGEAIGSSESYYLPRQMENVPAEGDYLVHLYNDDTLRTTSVVVHRLSLTECAKKYDEMRRECADSVWFPAIGDSVDLIRNDGVLLKCRFIGFDLGGVRLSGIGGRADTMTADFLQIHSITDKQGRSLSRDDAIGFKAKMVPSIYEIIVETESGRVSIPMSDVWKIESRPSWFLRNEKWAFLTAGLVIDVLYTIPKLFEAVRELFEAKSSWGLMGSWPKSNQ